MNIEFKCGRILDMFDLTDGWMDVVFVLRLRGFPSVQLVYSSTVQLRATVFSVRCCSFKWRDQGGSTCFGTGVSRTESHLQARYWMIW